MSQGEKRGVLRARVTALRARAAALVEGFSTPATREIVEAVILRLDEELDRLDEARPGEPLPPLRAFLPQTTARLDRLANLLRTQGRHAVPTPDLTGELDRRVAPPARRPRVASKRSA